MRLRWALYLVILLFPFAHLYGAQDSKLAHQISDQIRFKVEKMVLDNGLTVLFHEDHSAPIISYQQWFRVGSRHEKPGRTGLAHFFEHLMFKGTKKYPEGSLEKIIQSNGGTNNAFTTRDYTGYYINFPSGKLEVAIDIDSDRMTGLNIEPHSVQSEREVVKEERRYRVDNNIMGSLSEALYHTVYKVHPYKWPVIGYMKDLNAATIDDLKEFYRVYYAPNNAVVVIAGDFKTSEAKHLIKKYFAKIPRQDVPKPADLPEPEQTGARAVTLTKNVQNPTFAVAYKTAAAGTDDGYVLDLISNILGNGDSSRLHRLLVYKTQMASSVGAWSYTPAEPGFFQIYAALKQGQDVNRALQLTHAEIYKMRMELVTEEELAKAKNQVMMDYVNSLKTISGKAYALALNEVLFSSYEHLFKDLDRYNAITREQIKEVAAKYLLPQRRSVIQVVPKPADSSGQGV